MQRLQARRQGAAGLVPCRRCRHGQGQEPVAPLLAGLGLEWAGCCLVLMACPHCGSWSVKADRSLAGRLVCGRCGRPLQGVAAAGRRASTPRRWFRFGRLSPALRWLLLLLALSAGLAWLAEAPPRPRQPAADPVERRQFWKP